MSYIVFGIGAGLCLLAMVILLAVLRIHRGRRSQQQDDVPPRKNGPQDQPGKGGKGGKGGGRAALHTSHASLISNVHDYEDVTDDAVSQIQDPHSRKGSKDSAPGAALPDSGMYTHFPSHGPKSMDLSQLDLPGLMLTNQNTDLHFSRRLGDGAETVPTLINDHNDEGDYEEIPNFCPPYPATQQPEAQLPTTLASPEGLPSGPVSPTALPQSRSRGDLAPMRVAPTPAGRAGQPQDSAPPVVVMRRKANGSSPKKSAQKPPLPESGDLSVEQQRQLLLLNTGLLALETAVRKSMEIQDDELVMIDNALYGTLPRRGSLPTTEL